MRLSWDMFAEQMGLPELAMGGAQEDVSDASDQEQGKSAGLGMPASEPAPAPVLPMNRLEYTPSRNGHQ
jgi:hypothetical protein